MTTRFELLVGYRHYIKVAGGLGFESDQYLITIYLFIT